MNPASNAVRVADGLGISCPGHRRRRRNARSAGSRRRARRHGGIRGRRAGRLFRIRARLVRKAACAAAWEGDHHSSCSCEKEP